MNKPTNPIATAISAGATVIFFCVALIALAYMAGVAAGFAVDAFTAGWSLSQ